jgi:hypothetical protein
VIELRPRRGRFVSIVGVGVLAVQGVEGTVRRASSSATNTASRLAGSAALAFSLTLCSLPGGSKKPSPALETLTDPVAEFSERIEPEST